MRTIFLAGGIALAIGGHAAAQESFYTPLDLDKCELLSFSDEGAGGASWRCDGHRGVPLYIAEGDLRFTIAVGEEIGSFVTPSPFNSLGETVEWRYGAGDAGLQAIIIRYHLAPPDGVGRGTSELAVIAAPNEERPSCYIGFVKATAAPGQNEAARMIADRAKDAPCLSNWGG